MTGILACLALLLGQLPQATGTLTDSQQPKASIDGTVTRTGTGEAVARARLLLSFLGGQAANQKFAYTDQYGRFSFSDLEAGRYNLNVFANGYVRQLYGQRNANSPGRQIVLTAGQQMKDVHFDMVPTAVITGRIFDFDNMPLPGADVTLQRFAYDINGQRNLQAVQQARTDDRGEYRLYWVSPGRYFLRAEFSGSPGPFNRSPNEYFGPREEGYTATYYPGTADVSAASEVELLPGAQLSAMDLSMARTKTFKVTGRIVVTAAAAVPNARPFVTMRPRQPAGAVFIGTGGNVINNADGTFEIRSVVPGSYTLMASLGSGPNVLRVEEPIEVQSDLENVVIRLGAALSLPFRIRYEGQPPAAGPNGNTSVNMRPVLRYKDSNSPAISMSAPPAVKPDGTFTIAVMPGTYQVSLAPLPSPDHYIKAITFGNMDALRDGIVVEHAPDVAVEILLSSNGGRLEGTALDRDGKPFPGALVVLIPADQRQPERYKFGSTDNAGRFTLRGIHPGEYRLFSWDSIEPNAYRDPEFVRRYEEQGRRVNIVEGPNPAVEFRVIRVQ